MQYRFVNSAKSLPSAGRRSFLFDPKATGGGVVLNLHRDRTHLAIPWTIGNDDGFISIRF